MNETEVSQYIIDSFQGVDVIVNEGNSFFFYNPPDLPTDHMFPFTTLMTNDINDQFSNLNRPSIFRLNIGVGKETFRSLFGLPAKRDSKSEYDNPYSGYDFTALDQLMPHPVYARQYWLCVPNPSNETFETKVRPLLNEAYEMAVDKRRRKAT